MQNILIRATIAVFFLAYFFYKSMTANIEAFGRKDNIDYPALYIGTKTLETDRLILRQISLADAEDMFQFTSNSEVETWDPVDRTIKDTLDFIESLQRKYKAKEPALWGIVDKQQNKLIGYCGFTYFQPNLSIAELEYALDKPYWGKGLMSEALKSILSFTFNKVKLNRIVAFTVMNNQRSQKFLLKNGFKFEGLHREAGYSQGYFYDLKSFALIRQDYLAMGK